METALVEVSPLSSSTAALLQNNAATSNVDTHFGKYSSTNKKTFPSTTASKFEGHPGSFVESCFTEKSFWETSSSEESSFEIVNGTSKNPNEGAAGILEDGEEAGDQRFWDSEFIRKASKEEPEKSSTDRLGIHEENQKKD
jgi:hypothetical protein